MLLPLTVTLVSAPGLAVFLVARSSFFTWATANIKPLNKRALHRIRFISDEAGSANGMDSLIHLSQAMSVSALPAQRERFRVVDAVLYWSERPQISENRP